ncbi:MAG: MBOAT family protein, partial [Christensenellaceae bacterium]|nr:MBOAT family protein [Christensenellaceae bacterium]
PIGISFYTFQTMSYSIDVYRGDAEMQKNIVDFGAFVTMFPQLIAGPIVRYKDVAAQLKERTVCLEKVGRGSIRFIRGMAKKVLLANAIGQLWNGLAFSPADPGEAWLGAVAFAFQIFFDFSGYSDMAIGLGRMMGFDFPENFNAPYVSSSVSEFWRRWHMSLGTWFRDYVYFPLGGSRVAKKSRMVLNLAVVWALTGFWHGASWNFLLWGVYFGLLIILEKLFLQRAMESVKGAFGSLLRHGYALLTVLLGWVIFACEDIALMGRYFATMFGAGGGGHAAYLLSNYGVLLVLCVLASLPWRDWARTERWKTFWQRPAAQACRMLAYAGLLVLCVAYLVDSSFNPFLYFRF